MSRMSNRLRQAVAAGALLAALAGCTAPTPWVKPYEREHFADPIMSFNRDPVSSVYLDHVLESIYKKYNKMGFTMLGVNVEPDSNAANDWLKATPVSFPILYDRDSKVSKLYDVGGMPSTVIIDRSGKVRVLHRGYKPGDENQYLDSIRTLVRE